MKLLNFSGIFLLSRHFLNTPYFYWIGTMWAGMVPRKISYFLAQIVADISYVFYRKAVENVKLNLRQVLQNRSDQHLSSIVRRMFRNYSKYLVDYCAFTHYNGRDVIDQIAEFYGRENLDTALNMKKGIILLTAHLGNWELGGIFFGNCGVKTNVITLNDSNAEIDYVRRWYREKHKVSTITVGTSPFAMVDMVNALQRGELLAMLIDRHRSELESMSGDFFGRTSLFPKGPFVLSRLTGAPIIVAFVVRDKNGYRGIVNPHITVKDEKDEPRALAEVIKTFEKYIIMYPDQWYNFDLLSDR